jgi:hypothetical protein
MAHPDRGCRSHVTFFGQRLRCIHPNQRMHGCCTSRVSPAPSASHFNKARAYVAVIFHCNYGRPTSRVTLGMVIAIITPELTPRGEIRDDQVRMQSKTCSRRRTRRNSLAMTCPVRCANLSATACRIWLATMSTMSQSNLVAHRKFHVNIANRAN